MSPLGLMILKNRLAELKTRTPTTASGILETGRWQLELAALQLEIAEALLRGS